MKKSETKHRHPTADHVADTASLLLTLATVVAATVCLAGFLTKDAAVGVISGTVALFCLAASLMCFTSRSNHHRGSAAR